MYHNGMIVRKSYVPYGSTIGSYLQVIRVLPVYTVNAISPLFHNIFNNL